MKTEHFKRDFSEKQVKKDYSRVAWFYDFWGRLTESKAARRVVERASVKDGEHILEVAVGTGNVFREIVRKNQQGMNEGLDLSDSMLLRTEKKLKKYPGECYHLQTGNAYHLPFRDRTFDLVVNNFMIDLLPETDFEIVLTEFYRVLKSSGRLVVSTMAFGRKWVNGIWHWVARKHPSILTGCRPVSISNHLCSVGFSNVEVEFISQNTFPAEVLYASKGVPSD